MRRYRILVVDDEPDVCELIEDVLDDYEVLAVGTFEAAKSTLSSESFDAVILDIMGVNGLQLLAMFGGRFPCIVLTAHALNASSFQKALGGQARLFLPKSEMVRLDMYIERIIEEEGPLWDWLAKMVDFRDLFGEEWSLDDVLASVER